MHFFAMSARLTLGGSEVDNIAIRLEHVDLLDSLDRLGAKLLQGLLKLLVIGTGPGRRTLDLSPGGTLSAVVNDNVSERCFLWRGRHHRPAMVNTYPKHRVSKPMNSSHTFSPIKHTNASLGTELLEALLNVRHDELDEGGVLTGCGGGASEN